MCGYPCRPDNGLDGLSQSDTRAGSMVSWTTAMRWSDNQVEVHLISQALAKSLDGSSGVVLAAIVPAIYESLNPLTRGTKESSHSEGRAIPPMNDAKPVAVRAFILQV